MAVYGVALSRPASVNVPWGRVSGPNVDLRL